MSSVKKDFDRLAQLDDDGWTHNNQYHAFLLREVPPACAKALDVGCGTGALSRSLAERAGQVIALDLSSEMIRVARARSAHLPNIEYRCEDVMSCELQPEAFDCVATIATLHHLPQRAVFIKLAQTLKPGGKLLVIDLFEPVKSMSQPAAWRDGFLSLIAMGTSVVLRLIHNGRLRPPKEVRAAWEEHGKTDSYLTLSEVRDLCAEILPGAKVRQHLLWRYSIIWQK